MLNHLICYLSSSYDADLTLIEEILAEQKVEIYGFYDGSIGNSFQEILKRKLRQADFALFVLTETNQNIIYEIGVCEGLGKQSFVIVDAKQTKLPFYLENQLSISANLEDKPALELAIRAFLKELPAKKSKPEKPRPDWMATPAYNEEVKEVLRSLLVQTRQLRENGQSTELIYIVEEVFKTLRMKYLQQANPKDRGIDFAVWNDTLGRVMGNPIVVECKMNLISKHSARSAIEQILHYAKETDATLALLIYLNRDQVRIPQPEAGLPLILAFDLEDFIENLIFQTFESLVLARRNANVHTKRS